jgi:hypothetical protein
MMTCFCDGHGDGEKGALSPPFAASEKWGDLAALAGGPAARRVQRE